MDFAGKKIIVVGAGVSGIGAAKVLAKERAEVILNDYKQIDLSEAVEKELRSLGVKMVFGYQEEALLQNVHLVVVSPGLALTVPFIKTARTMNIPVVGEVEIAWALSKAPILGITGTNGKTTTTALLGAVLREAHITICIGGNIGDALCEEVEKVPAEGYVVAELSSYQLESISSFKALGAIVLNITPDHLARHKTMEAYQAAKERIFENQNKEDYTVLNQDDEAVYDMRHRTKGSVLLFSQKAKVSDGAYALDGAIYAVKKGVPEKVCAIETIPIPGAHNVENVLAVVALCYALGISVEVLSRAISKFPGVEHRIEYVTTFEGVDYYNDSKATNTDSTIKALEAFDRPIVLIAGGFDKMTDLKAMMHLTRQKVRALVLMGAAAARFNEAAQEAKVEDISLVVSMREAIQRAKEKALDGDIILLSPACSSFDTYSCFEERGDDFKAQVRAMTIGG